MSEITNKTTLEKILEIPGAEKVLAKHSVPCLSCPMASFEISRLEIGQVCKMYGLPLKEILVELNFCLRNKKN